MNFAEAQKLLRHVVNTTTKRKTYVRVEREALVDMLLEMDRLRLLIYDARRSMAGLQFASLKAASHMEELNATLDKTEPGLTDF